ncbi:MAG TPA: pitrilysin family protein [Gemmatimonadaceae bacterium]|nr:pitrilysin family protein [Gemmatimonadaceae bacterium]
MPSPSSTHHRAAGPQRPVAPRPRATAGAIALAIAGAIATATTAAAQSGAPPTPTSATAGTARATPTPGALRQDTLDNGLRIIVVENHSVPLATVALVVRTGAMTQEEDEQGVPHLFEHMLFKAYRGPGGRPFVYEAAALQAAFNGGTAEELVSYYLTLPSAGTDGAVRLLARLVKDAHFSATDLQTERFVVLGEMQRDNSEPNDVLQRAVARDLWRDGWPRKNTIGDATALLSVTPDRLQAIYDTWYVPNNAALVVTGDVAHPRVVEAARRHFGSWKRRPDPLALHPPPPMPALDSSRAVILPADVATVTVQVQWQGPRAREDVADTYAADVLSDVLDDPQSHFTRRLVDEGPFQYARVGYTTLAHTGPITFVGATTLAQLPVALTVLGAELATMGGDGYFEPRALAVAAKRRRVARSFEQEEAVTLANTLGYWWAVTGLPYYESYVDSLAVRRPEELTRFVRRYMTGRPFITGVLVPAGKEREVSVLLDQFIAFFGQGGR